MSPTTHPHERLDAAMEERRQALGMTWAEVASAADITVETLRAIRRGKNEPSSLTKRGLDKALQWEAGSVQRLLSGKEPIPIGGSTPPANTETPDKISEESAAEHDNDPVAAHFEALLAQVTQRTEERLAELTKRLDDAARLAAESNKRAEESQEMLRKLLDERKGA